MLGYRRSRQPAMQTTTTTIHSGGGAVVGENVSTNGGDWTGRDSIVTSGGNITSIRVERDLVIQTAGELVKLASPAAGDPAALRRATEAYLNYLLDRYRYLQLKGMGVHDRVPLQLPLLDLYVPLKARLEMPEGDDLAAPLAPGRPAAGAGRGRGRRAGAGRPAGRACVRPGPAGPARRPDHPGRSGRGQDYLPQGAGAATGPGPGRAPGHRRAAAAAGLAGRLRQRAER
ncbi:MAG: hypothetical protein V9H69_14035 [Anaerolineae bacterium]